MELTLREAKARLSEVLDRAAAGEIIEIVRQGARKGRFRVMAVEPAGSVRRPGALRGVLTVPDDFDAPDPAMLDAFEGR